jgi:hypothetical protein
MSEDRILRELGHLAKEEGKTERARLDERWDRLAAGTLTPEEDAELRALAATSPEARETYEAFRPLGPEFQARVVDKIAAELKRPTEHREPRFRLLPFRPTMLRRAGWLTAATAAAAVLMLVLRPPAPLPDYSLGLSGGSSVMRGERPEGAVPDFAPGDRFKVILHPQTAASRALSLEAQCFLLRGRELRRLEVKSQLDPGGAVMMEGSMDRDLQPGTWTLWAVVGRRGELPEPADLRSLATRAEVRQRDWVALPKEVRIRRLSP